MVGYAGHMVVGRQSGVGGPNYTLWLGPKPDGHDTSRMDILTFEGLMAQVEITQAKYPRCELKIGEGAFTEDERRTIEAKFNPEEEILDGA